MANADGKGNESKVVDGRGNKDEKGSVSHVNGDATDSAGPIMENSNSGAGRQDQNASGSLDRTGHPRSRSEDHADTVLDHRNNNNRSKGRTRARNAVEVTDESSDGGGEEEGQRADDKEKRGAADAASANDEINRQEEGSGESSSSTDESSSTSNEESGKEEDAAFVQPVNDSRKVRIELMKLNEHLVCRLCAGYYCDAFTIVECSHTFCKACLLKLFNDGGRKCPTCNGNLGPNPRNSIMFDRTMQEIVDKLLPHLQPEDEQMEIAFYETLGIKTKAEVKKEIELSRLRKRHEKKREREGNAGDNHKRGAASVKTEPPAAESQKQNRSPTANVSKHKEGSEPTNKKAKITMVNAQDQVAFRLAPDLSVMTPSQCRLPALDKPFLRTSGKLKILHLRKYIDKKLPDVKDPEEVEFLCQGHSLAAELSLEVILRTRWPDAKKDLVIHYRRKRVR